MIGCQPQQNQPGMPPGAEAPAAPARRLPPRPGIFIPDIPRGPDAWLTAVAQWEGTGDGGGLKDWKVEWYTGEMKDVTGTKRGLRKTIAEEFICV